MRVINCTNSARWCITRRGSHSPYATIANCLLLYSCLCCRPTYSFTCLPAARPTIHTTQTECSQTSNSNSNNYAAADFTRLCTNRKSPTHKKTPLVAGFFCGVNLNSRPHSERRINRDRNRDLLSHLAYATTQTSSNRYQTTEQRGQTESAHRWYIFSVRS